MLHYSCKN